MTPSWFAHALRPCTSLWCPSTLADNECAVNPNHERSFMVAYPWHMHTDGVNTFLSTFTSNWKATWKASPSALNRAIFQCRWGFLMGSCVEFHSGQNLVIFSMTQFITMNASPNACSKWTPESTPRREICEVMFAHNTILPIKLTGRKRNYKMQIKCAENSLYFSRKAWQI